MSRFRYLSSLPVALVSCILATVAYAQSNTYTRQELSLGYATYPTAPTFRYTINLSPSLAIETRLSGLPSPVFNNYDAVHLTAGLKAGLRRGHWDFFGTMAPGWALRPDTESHDTATTIGNTTYITGTSRSIERSLFLLTTGVGASYSVSSRNFVRLDLDAIVEPTFARQILPLTYIGGGIGVGEYTPGEIRSYGAFTVTAGHRFGRLIEDQQPRPVRASHLEGGAFFSMLGHTPQLSADTTVDPGAGGWLGTSLTQHIDAEIAGFWAPHDDLTRDIQDGGKRSAISAGIKSGFRRDHVGIFAKARGGLMRFSGTFAGSSYATYDDYFNDFEGHPTWEPILDLGGVVEVYPARHLVLRAEAGPTVVFLRSTTFSLAGMGGNVPSQQTVDMTMLFGGGFRF